MRRILSLLASCLLLCQSAFSQKVAVATLHPILTDLVKQVGGDMVTITPLMKAGADVHGFSPTPADIKSLRQCSLVLASGKKLETYLDKLRDNLTAGQTIVEVGRDIPSLQVNPKDAAFVCCPEHAAGAIDPHWWNSVDNMKRAAGIVAESLAKIDPGHADTFNANAATYAERLAELKKWARKELSSIPQSRRVLATSHLALLYFAKEFGFKLIPVHGLSPQSSASAAEVATAIAKIRENKIPAIFPDAGVNTKQLDAIIRESGTKRGGSLIADGNGSGQLAGFEAAFRSNVAEICAALK